VTQDSGIDDPLPKQPITYTYASIWVVGMDLTYPKRHYRLH